jgi:dethiobiotin synthetase/adenosylmethionine--8-amino-7-oxononanoate aminotransferase
MFDEVFTGLYRLGRFSAASLLQVHPDVSIHAKLLTGGLLPLSTTLASTSIFNAFLGDEKADALLHGHSYTAHPIGCHVANTTLQTMERVKATYTWSGFRKDWTTQALNGQQQLKINTIKPAPEDEGVWSFWSKDTVEKLSYHAKVDHVIAIGSVLAISLKDTSGSGKLILPAFELSQLRLCVGYTSTAAVGLRDALMNETANAKMSVHTRVLGNVIYFMAAMTSTPKNLRGVEQAVLEKLDGVKGLRTESERF